MFKLQNATINNFVAQENDKYGDILVMGFNDHYYNLTLKDYGFFEYILKHCKNVNCILKPDIDTVINIPGFELLCDLSPGQAFLLKNQAYLHKKFRKRANDYWSILGVWSSKKYPIKMVCTKICICQGKLCAISCWFVLC